MLLGADGTRLEGLPGRYTKKFALLIYLACAGRRSACRRDELVAMFWPDSTKSHSLNSLRQSLFVIRRELGPGVISGLGAQEIAIDGRYLTADVDAFERALRGGRPEAALKLYAEDFLSGFHVSGAPEFGFWVDEQRERLRAKAARAAEGLARKSEASQILPDALFWWRKRLDIDPYHEPTLRRIVSLTAASGNRTGALQELERFRRRVRREIDVGLSPPTQELASRLAAGNGAELPHWMGERRREGVADGTWAGFRRATDQAQF